MKRLIILTFVIIFLLGACGISEPEETPEEKPVHTFRGHKLGDTLEDVIEKEGMEPYEQSESKAFFKLDDFYSYDCIMQFDFDDRYLKRIIVRYFPKDTKLNFQEVFDNVLPNLIGEFGEPFSIREDDDSSNALWWKDGIWEFYIDEFGFILEINVGYQVD